MKFLELAFRGLRHYRRTQLGVLAGTVIATATLVGALVVGDSVRHSLMKGALDRIGDVHTAMSSGDRFFRSDLATNFGPGSAPVVLVSGVGSSADGSQRLHDIQVLGVDERFFQLAPGEKSQTPPAAGEALINSETALRLNLEPEDVIVLRVEMPSALPRDMALSPGDVSLALRVTVTQIISEESFSEFGLRGGSSAKSNVLVNLTWLQDQLKVPGRANLVLATDDDVPGLNKELASNWELDDAELHLEQLDDGRLELSTGRIFFDAPILQVLENLPDVALEGVFTYFVNGLKNGDRSIPYSMVSGLGALNSIAETTPAEESQLVAALHPGEILLNTWAQEDLQVELGDSISLDYYVIDASRQLVERSETFRLAGTVAMEGVGADKSLMPDFPGLADSENCRDWEPGTPVDLDRIRDKDEVYWDEFGGTPKAFMQLAASRTLWTSRFGALTSVRFDSSGEASLRTALKQNLSPPEVGLQFRDVRTPALAGGDSATDFGGLFIGLSFFLIVAALLLSAQLFLFGVEQRSREIGLYGALGFPKAFVRRLLLTEVALIAVFGAALGSCFGLGYTQLVLVGLASVWQDAIASVQLDFHANPATVLMGFSISVIASLFTAWFALRKALDIPASHLLSGAGQLEQDLSTANASSTARAKWLATGGIVAALAVVFTVDPGAGPSAAGAFFGAGALVLVSGLVFCRLLLRKELKASDLSKTMTALGWRNNTRRPSRSLATIALMAIGTFLVVAVGANRLGPTQDSAERKSGTGGFAIWGRSSLPIVHDMNTVLGREALGLSEQDMRGVQVVPMRVLPGDDASCLNLARPQAPPLLGVPSAELSSRDAFQFGATIEETDDPWSLLATPLKDGAVPAIGDVTSLTWQMHMGVGDSLTYTDERGHDFEVRIVGAVSDSILQGTLLIDEQQFEARFPTQGGHRRFLIDAPSERIADVSADLTRSLRDLGLALEPSARRLDSFHAVQNTYLTIFQGLGGLGLLLGSIGLGMVLLRNTLERRAELALMAALGFAPTRVRWLVFSEYGFLLMLGLGAGAIAALVAILPAMRAPGSDLSLLSFWILCVAVGLNGAFWLLLATRVAVQRVPLDALRAE